MRHEAGSIIINSSHVDLDFVSAYQVRKYNNVFFWYKGTRVPGRSDDRWCIFLWWCSHAESTIHVQ